MGIFKRDKKKVLEKKQKKLLKQFLRHPTRIKDNVDSYLETVRESVELGIMTPEQGAKREKQVYDAFGGFFEYTEFLKKITGR